MKLMGIGRKWLALASMLCVVSAMTQPSDGQDYPVRWWKGNLHTHTLWSDGDDFPEMSADWYQRNGYNFLALTDHNVLSQGIRWMKVQNIIDRGGATALEKYLARFGDDWVETRGEPGMANFEVRLKPFDEYRYLVEQHDRFILIPAEEISDKAEGKPVHMNATNLAEVVKPVGGQTVRESIANNLRAVQEQADRLGREILVHLNHPNFGWAITPEDIAYVTDEQFYEVYNGHPGVNHLGDDTRPSVERFWDLANALRLTVLNSQPLLGIATDDTHDYHGEPGSHAGRGWVMVRSAYLTPEHLIKAMRKGDFYASSGVSLETIAYDTENQTLTIKVQPVDNESFSIAFIGTMRPSEDEPLAGEQIGVTLAEVKGDEATYQLTGEELYVRAVVTSSAAAEDPSFKGQKKQAWTQPVGWKLKP